MKFVWKQEDNSEPDSLASEQIEDHLSFVDCMNDACFSVDCLAGLGFDCIFSSPWYAAQFSSHCPIVVQHA